MLQVSSAADVSGKSKHVRTVEHKNPVVDDIADNAAGRSAIADLQCAGADRGAPGIVVRARQRQIHRTLFSDSSGAADRSAQKQVGIGLERAAGRAEFCHAGSRERRGILQDSPIELE